MGFSDLRISPLTDSPARGIAISFNFEHPRNEIPLTLQGEIYSEDGKFLGPLNSRNLWKNSLEGSIHGQYEIPAYQYDPRLIIGKTGSPYQMTGMFDQLTVEFIESVRQKNKKRDVIFIVSLSATILDHGLRMMNNVYVSHRKNPNIAFPAFADSEVPYDKRLNVVVAVGDMALKLYNSGELRISIPASDWIHDYQERLGLGRHLIIESKLPELEKLELQGNQNNDQKILSQRLSKSIEIVKDIQKEFNKGEWGTVVEESVKLFELIGKDNKGIIKNLITESTGISNEKAQSLTDALDKLYGYAADLHHPVDRDTKGVKQPFFGEKEDAELIYTVSLSIVNLLERKLVKSLRNP